ncbi:uncharacterized protein at3g28850 [Phtheirospermum japonicum]|uniref:Uncharacterized protein at3g28850 n=1 Tax=Phtheirospermum japonicum TaxID=374723 RepID=A0A830B524_9LAMI|nr:uncharacterized protein at3g28850 [Phtheirospermum japonicum]
MILVDTEVKMVTFVRLVGTLDLFIARSVQGVVKYITREIMMMRKGKKKLMKVSVNMIFIGVPIATKIDSFVARFVVINDVLVKQEGSDEKISFAGPAYPLKKHHLLPCIKCEKKPEGSDFKEVSVERYPYHSYMDSTSGQLEPASGARARDESLDEESSDERKDSFSDFVVYQTEPKEEEELTGYILDKKIGRPHAFIDPKAKKPIEEPLTSEELWWNWRKPDKEQWSRWQIRRPDVEMVFIKAMAETGQVKLFGSDYERHELLTSEELWWNWRKPDKEQWSRWQRKRPDVEMVFLKAMAETEQVKLFGNFVVYQTEPKEEEELIGYVLDKKIGRPHAFIDPKAKKPIEEPLTSEELWWNWRKPDKEQWSRFGNLMIMPADSNGDPFLSKTHLRSSQMSVWSHLRPMPVFIFSSHP